jgi:N-ethylmaleimide reductase
MTSPFFSPITVGAFDFPNRIVMAPMTRSRSDDEGRMPGYAADYYRRRCRPRSRRSFPLQLWHTGRISHPDLHGGERPVAPSAIRPEGQAFTKDGMQDHVEPRALETDEIPAIVADYRRAGKNAWAAGFPEATASRARR